MTAGVVSALGSGAEPEEAALLGNVVASITIQQVGTTDTASRAQVRERFDHFEHGWAGFKGSFSVKAT